MGKFNHVSVSGIFILIATFGCSTGLVCYNCEWMDMEGMNPVNCRDGETSAASADYPSSTNTTAYCMTIWGMMEGTMNHAYGLRTGFPVQNDLKFDDGECTSALPPKFHHMDARHIDGVNVTKVCYCTTAKCNTTPLSSSAVPTGVMVSFPIIVSILTFSFLYN